MGLLIIGVIELNCYYVTKLGFWSYVKTHQFVQKKIAVLNWYLNSCLASRHIFKVLKLHKLLETHKI